MERGNLQGASESVLDALARALQLDEAERAHLFDLARAERVVPVPGGDRRWVRPGIQRVVDAITAPAWVRNGRSDFLAKALRRRDPNADDIVAVLRAETGRNPYDRGLTDLVGSSSTRSEDFRTRWAAHDVQFHRPDSSGCTTRSSEPWT